MGWILVFSFIKVKLIFLEEKYKVVSENSQEYKTPGKKEFQSSSGRQSWGLPDPFI
jgi:hypothetical protein